MQNKQRYELGVEKKCSENFQCKAICFIIFYIQVDLNKKMKQD